jgi:hypothetical protein
MRRFYAECTDSLFLSQAVREMMHGKESPILRQAVAELNVQGQAKIAKSPDTTAAQQLQPAAPHHRNEVVDFVRQLVAEIPWGHHLLILNKLTDAAARFYYLRATAQFGWSRNVLLNQIKAGAYERAVKEKKSHNFELALPENFAE